MKIVRQKGKPWELFDLSKDPSETTDLAKEHPEKVKTLEAIYQRERKKDK